MFLSSSFRRCALILLAVLASLTVKAELPLDSSSDLPSDSPVLMLAESLDDSGETSDTSVSHVETFVSSVANPLKLQIEQFVYEVLAVLAVVVPVVILFFLGPVLISLIKQYVAVCALKTDDEIEELFEDVEDNALDNTLDGESLWDEASAYAGLEDVDEIDVDDCLDDSDLDRAKEGVDHVW